jgi:hypothetical protein
MKIIQPTKVIITTFTKQHLVIESKKKGRACTILVRISAVYGFLDIYTLNFV